MHRLLPLLLLAAAGCRGPEVTVRVSIPDLDGVETPVPGLMVTFLPYDRDSVIAALEAQAESPRPNTRVLDSLRALFQVPFTEVLRVTAITSRLEAERDSLTAAGAPAGGRLAAVRDSLAALAPRLARARAALDSARTRYYPVMDSLQALVRRWNDRTYAAYDSGVRATPGRRHASPVADTTDARGWATTEVTDGRWWVTARSIDPTDPNMEWYWNVPVTADTVPLDSRSGRRRPRY